MPQAARDDASIVPYRRVAGMAQTNKVSLRRDEGIPPYRDKYHLACIRKKQSF